MTVHRNTTTLRLDWLFHITPILALHMCTKPYQLQYDNLMRQNTAAIATDLSPLVIIISSTSNQPENSLMLQPYHLLLPLLDHKQQLSHHKPSARVPTHYLRLEPHNSLNHSEPHQPRMAEIVFIKCPKHTQPQSRQHMRNPAPGISPIGVRNGRGAPLRSGRLLRHFGTFS